MAPPPFQITAEIFTLATEIARLLGRYEGLLSPKPEPRLRRQNQIRTIQGSLAIEGNTLSIEQVTALLDHKRVAGSPRELREVQNAIRAYELAPELKPDSRRDLLRAHAVLMDGLLPSPGRYRTTNVGIIKGTKVGHVAPKPEMVPTLMNDLLAFLRTDRKTPSLIKACVFHYELEFIHPFMDGNGRMGRLWQHVILLRESSAFAYLPVESLIKERQDAYYAALATSDREGESTGFIAFMLIALHDALAEFLTQVRGTPLTCDMRLQIASDHFHKDAFARKDYLKLFKTLSSATASRDLQLGVDEGRLVRDGDKAQARYRFV